MKKKPAGYYTNRHSCFLLQYHMVLVTKFRHPVIKGEIELFFKEYTESYFRERELPILAMETMQDHVHILFEAPPQIRLDELVNAYKSATSRHIRKNFPEQLKPYYWKPFFWSQSYFIGSVSERTTSVVTRYIQTQKE